MRQKELEKRAMKPIVLTDFDGTACRIDIGEGLMKKHVGPQWPGLIADWKMGRISTVECFTRECELAKLTRKTIVFFAQKQSLEPSFLAFLSVLRPQGVPLVILSDGLDIYIELLLKQHRIRDVAFFANHAAFPEGRLVPEFPYYGQGCGACGNCKGSHVRRYQQEGYSPVVFVGNGLSDRCVVGLADILFAKDDLLDFARSENVDAVPFRDFQDVHRELVKRKVIN